MVATFLDLNKNRPGPANIAEKKEKIDMYDFPVPDCIEEQNGNPQFSSIDRQCKWPSLSRTIVEIQKFCYHGNLTSRFSPFLWVSLHEFHDVNEFFSQTVKKQWACEIILLCALLPGKSFKFDCFVISNIATIFACTMQLTSFAQ